MVPKKITQPLGTKIITQPLGTKKTPKLSGGKKSLNLSGREAWRNNYNKLVCNGLVL